MTPRPFSHDLAADGRTLTLHGEVDEGAAVQLRSVLKELTDDGSGPLTVVLSDVDFLPSVAVGVLASAQARVASGATPIGFAATEGSIARRVLTICGLACADD